MNVEHPDGGLIAVHSTSTPLGRAMTRVFELSRDLPADFLERLEQLPGQPRSGASGTEQRQAEKQ